MFGEMRAIVLSPTTRGLRQCAPVTPILANSALLQLDPANPAEVHFDLARALHRKGDPTARRHVLQALEEAARYQAALRLLLQLQTNSPAPLAEAPPAGKDSP